MTPEARHLALRDLGNLASQERAEARRLARVAEQALQGCPYAADAYELIATLRDGSKRAAKLPTMAERFAAR